MSFPKNDKPRQTVRAFCLFVKRGITNKQINKLPNYEKH